MSRGCPCCSCRSNAAWVSTSRARAPSSCARTAASPPAKALPPHDPTLPTLPRRAGVSLGGTRLPRTRRATACTASASRRTCACCASRLLTPSRTASCSCRSRSARWQAASWATTRARVTVRRSVLQPAGSARPIWRSFLASDAHVYCKMLAQQGASSKQARPAVRGRKVSRPTAPPRPAGNRVQQVVSVEYVQVGALGSRFWFHFQPLVPSWRRQRHRALHVHMRIDRPTGGRTEDSGARAHPTWIFPETPWMSEGEAEFQGKVVLGSWYNDFLRGSGGLSSGDRAAAVTRDERAVASWSVFREKAPLLSITHGDTGTRPAPRA
jgi:hypothetical protein